MPKINFTVTKFENFKAQYQEACKKRKSSFIFEENEYLVGYAKYLIEYLNSKFQEKN